MSGFENYPEELAQIDREILRHAASCGVDLSLPEALARLRETPATGLPADPVRESLRGLLILRLKVETEMIEQGLTPPPFRA